MTINEKKKIFFFFFRNFVNEKILIYLLIFRIMEDELKCSYCGYFYCNPVLLPCCHSLCFACALQLQEKFNEVTKLSNDTSSSLSSNPFANAAKSASLMLSSSNCTQTTPQSHSPQSISSSSSANIDQMCRTLSITDLGSSIISDLDKLSVFSETDSGVSSSANTSANTSNSSSRPCSYIGQQCSPDYLNLKMSNYKNSMQSLIQSPISISTPPLPPPQPPIFSASPLYSTFLPCPQCKRMIYMDETGVNSLTKNTCLENIVERYCESKKLSIKCQMCPPGSAEKDALLMCEQCEIYYCEQCRELCHPMRGPLIKHSLVAPKFGRELIKKKNRHKESKCSDHSTENVNLYCLLCKCPCCNLCVTESVHINHQTQPINSFCKSQKVKNLPKLRTKQKRRRV